MSGPESLHDRLTSLAERTVANNLWRQQRCFNLIPSEQTPSLLVKMFEIADPAGRYAEHRTIEGEEVYFYQGTDFVRDVEMECRRELASYLGCRSVELRPISGQMSNEVVYKAAIKTLSRKRDRPSSRLRCVVNNALRAGGHLSHQPMGSLFNFVETDPATGRQAVRHIPTRSDNPYRADIPALLELVSSVRPDLVIFGKSMFLYPEPVRELYELVHTWTEPPIVLYDMAHVLGLYGAFQQPFDDGADLVTGSTHKTFFGPQRGLIAGNPSDEGPWGGLWGEIQRRAFPGSTSNHHLGTLIGLLAASHEMIAFREPYQRQVRRNAKAFARFLAAAGVQVEGDPSDGYTETHQVVCRVSRHGTGEEIARRLEANHIIVNYQALPDDESFVGTSGIRIGVAEMTRFGMTEADFEPLASFMADVILGGRTVSDAVARYRRRFPSMTFCLPPDEAASLGARLLSSLLPDSEYVDVFAQRLREAGHVRDA